MYGYIIIAIVAGVACNVNAGCPSVQPVENFNMAAYANGIWYEIGRLPHPVETDANCGAASYKLEGNVFSINNTDVHNHRLRYIGGAGRMAPDAGNTGKMILTYPYGAGGSNIDVILWILGTDYNNYAVGYYCKYDPITGSRRDHAWVLSRSKQLSFQSRAAVDGILRDACFLDSSKLIWPDFSEAACTFLY